MIQRRSFVADRKIMELENWLRSIGLDQYKPVFREHQIDGTILPSLTAEDLKDLGVSIVGHRRKLLDAIAFLRSDAPRASPPILPEESAADGANESPYVYALLGGDSGADAQRS
jgi:hypothetical protein